MQIRTIATLAVAVMLGLIAVVLVRNYVGGPRTAPGQQTGQAVVAGMAPMVVASQPIERGAVLQANVLRVVQVPQDAVPQGAFQSVDQLTGAPEVQRVAMRSIIVNEPILPGKITDPGQRAILSTLVADGMRAVSLPATEVTGVAGFVMPGDKVDVLVTREVGETKVTQTLADNVLVLGVDQSSNDETSTPVLVKAITIQVTPDQAHVIALSRELGDVSVALRGLKDQGLPMRRATTTAALGFAPPRPAVQKAATRTTRPATPPAPAGEQIRVTRGTETTGYQVGGR